MTKDETLQSLVETLPTIRKIFENEPAVLKLSHEPIMIIGDIHGNLAALNMILAQRKDEKMLFLGDYIDRGEQGVEVLYTLFKLKLAEPDNIFLLRGNHEDEAMNEHYGFFDEINRDHHRMELLQQVFEQMPIAAIVNDSIFCVHGGIPGAYSIDTITKENSLQYLWNDPMNRNGLRKSMRGRGIFEFGPDITSDFLKLNNLTTIIRSHTAIATGYIVLFGGQLISIFSSPGYNEIGDLGAYLIFHQDEMNAYIMEVDK